MTLAMAALVTLTFSMPASATERVINSATAKYKVNGTPITTDSNKVSIVLRTKALVTFYKYAPLSPDPEVMQLTVTEYKDPTSGSFVPMPPPVPIRYQTPLGLNDELPFVAGNIYHGNEPLFLTLADGDQNLDPDVRETIILKLHSDCNGEEEILRLTETGSDTGVFFGYEQAKLNAPVENSNGIYSTKINCRVDVTYVDAVDGTDTSVAGALVDPYGHIVDTSNGDLVNGITVTLINTSTGLPATVFGDDGISSYPSTVISGQDVMDSSGAFYEYSTGTFRFPLISPGTYRFDVTSTAIYKVPSVVPTEEIQALPGGPFAIDIGSRLETFTVRLDILHIDIPVDRTNPPLYLTKDASKSSVSTGDFLQYRINASNTTASDTLNVNISDRLPLGFRYREGTTKVNGANWANPSISASGRDIVFNVGTIPAGEKTTVTYIVEIAAGAPFGEAANMAYAVGAGGVVSNTVSAIVTVKNAFFDNKGILMGRVSTGACKDEEAVIDEPVAGVRIYLEDGTYSVTDNKGMYHFEGINPGTHIVQMDPVSIPPEYSIADCGRNNFNSGMRHSQFVDLQGGTLWRANFQLIKNATNTVETNIKGIVGITLSGEKRAAGAEGNKNAVDYTVALNVGDVLINNVRITILLPDGAKYMKGSSSLGGAELPDPEEMETTLTYRLGDIGSGWAGTMLLAAELPDTGAEAEPSAAALLTFDSPLTKNLRVPLVKSVLSKQPADPSAPVESSSSNQIEFEATAASLNATEMEFKPSRAMPEYDAFWLDMSGPGFAWLWPYEGYHPSIPVAKIAVKYDTKKSLKLFLGGKEVNALYLDSVIRSSDGATAAQVWKNVPVFEGDNFFEAVVYNEDGAESEKKQFTMHYSGPPIKVEPMPKQPGLVANGKTPPVVAVRLTDKYGHPAREGVIGEFTVDPPYLPYKKIEDFQNNPISSSTNEKTKYIVGEDGIALISLQPTSKTGEAVLRFSLYNGEQSIRAWLTPEPRGWIVVGLAEETFDFNTIAGNKQNVSDSETGAGNKDLGRFDTGGEELNRWSLSGLANSKLEDRTQNKSRLAFFARGQKKNSKWLTTLSYDSEREGNIKKNKSLLSTIDPNTFYALYGDTTKQQYDSSSARPLYLKMERDRQYIMFGDFDTGLSNTELSKYNRRFNGIKTEAKKRQLGYSFYFTSTNQAFVKDELRGDGTSGLYRLSRLDIVVNSDSITIETRDRLHSETIVSTKRLSQHVDYDIDYAAGTLYFKAPVPRTDPDLNPVYIVVDYEANDSSDLSFNYGGRSYIKPDGEKLEIGSTYLHEGRINGTGNLYGLDAKWKYDKSSVLTAEYAQAGSDFKGDEMSGTAYIFQIDHDSRKLKGKIYTRMQDSDFGLGQQRGAESGTRKLGLDGTYFIQKDLNVRTELFKQFNLTTDAQRYMLGFTTKYNKKRYNLDTGYKYVTDTFADSQANTSQQVNIGGNLRMRREKITFSFARDQALKGKNTSGDFPSRTSLGADYKLNRTSTFFIAQDFFESSGQNTNAFRYGLKGSPWTGSQLNTSIVQNRNENGMNIYSTVALKQTWLINKKWSIDAGMDRTKTMKHPGDNAFNLNVPSATGGGSDFHALTLGAAYKAKVWTVTQRFETRQSSSERKIGAATGFFGENKKGLGIADVVQYFRTITSRGEITKTGGTSLSLAYRPEKSKWIVLDKLDFSVSSQKNTKRDFNNWHIVNNFNLNTTIRRKKQFSLLYGSKYVKETLDGMSFSGYTDLTAVEARYFLTRKWDIGARASLLHSWRVHQYNYGYGLSLGRNYARNLWVTLGYNFSGFVDRDFSDADFNQQGFFVKLRMRFDQGTMKDAARWLSGQGGEGTTAKKAEKDLPPKTAVLQDSKPAQPEKELTAITTPVGTCPADMAFIPPGKYSVGCGLKSKPCADDAIKPDTIEIEKGFCMDKTLVTRKDYSGTTGNNPPQATACAEDTCPVANITWREADAYCSKQGKRLPTELEWEIAARGGTDGRFFWGNNLDDDYAWTDSNSNAAAHPVMQKKPNQFGLYDMVGNMWEWTTECYVREKDYKKAVPEKALRGCNYMALRGGSWKTTQKNLGISSRGMALKESRLPINSFRCSSD